VLILDDGTAIRQDAQKIQEVGGTVVGVVPCLDGQGIGKEGETESAKAAPEGDLGGVKVFVLTMQGLIAYLEAGRNGASHVEDTGTRMDQDFRKVLERRTGLVD